MSIEDLVGDLVLDLADAIIRELDEITGDADAEPSLGSLGGAGRAAEQHDQRTWAGGARDDREEQCEGEGEPEHHGCSWPNEGDQRDLGRGW